MRPSLTIVIPALNEADRLPYTLASIRSSLVAASVVRLEILVVDDGSTDGTEDVAIQHGGSCTRVVRHSTRRGKGAAVRTGVAAVRQSDWILVMDADMAVPIEQLTLFWSAAAETPIVIGSKRMPGADLEYPRLRSLGSLVGQWIIAALAVRGFYDTQCGFKLFRRDVAQRLFAVQRLDGFGYDFEILHLARRYAIPVKELPVLCRNTGDGTVSLAAYGRTLIEALGVARRRLLGSYPSSLPSSEDSASLSASPSSSSSSPQSNSAAKS